MAEHEPTRARVGDLVDARGIPGRPARRGEIVELLGESGHEHYRVRWDESHESILYPADGVTFHRPSATGSHTIGA